MHNFDLHIALRVYPGVSKTPFIFVDDKFRLFQTGLYSLVEALQDINYKITVILDRCPRQFHEVVKKAFNNTGNLTIFPLEDGGNAKSFLKQIEILLEKEDSRIIMFAEDDYIYEGNSLSILLDLLKAKRADFVTPYDHIDYYTLLIHKKNQYEVEFKGKKFVNVNSTCLTFLTTPEVLKATKNVFETYIKKNSDASIFWALTKEHVLSPGSFIKFLGEAFRGNSQYIKLFIKAWIHSPVQIFFGKKYKILAPHPSLATHMEKGSLSPGIDWDQKAADLISRYEI
ncbi:MAG: glycosyltransferase family 2 protein [Ignavibacteriaceae bacterium]